MSEPFGPAPQPAYRVQVLDRTFAVLEVLANSPSELTLGQISRKVTLHKTTVHRLLSVLQRHEVVSKNADTGRYQLGLKLSELGSKASRFGPTAHCRSY